MTTTKAVYEPKGVQFWDGASQRDMILVGTDEPRESLRGWLCFRHPDGQWVTLRKATPEDNRIVMQALSHAFHEDATPAP